MKYVQLLIWISFLLGQAIHTHEEKSSMGLACRLNLSFSASQKFPQSHPTNHAIGPTPDISNLDGHITRRLKSCSIWVIGKLALASLEGPPLLIARCPKVKRVSQHTGLFPIENPAVQSSEHKRTCK